MYYINPTLKKVRVTAEAYNRFDRALSRRSSRLTGLCYPRECSPFQGLEVRLEKISDAEVFYWLFCLGKVLFYH